MSCVEEDNGFGVPVLSRSVETSKEEESERILEAEPLAVGAGEVESSEVKGNCLGILVEALKEIRRFMELDQIGVDKVECTCRLAP